MNQVHELQGKIHADQLVDTASERGWGTAIRASFASNLVFATPLAEYAPVRLTSGRIALVGDAAHLAVPATAAELLTGLADAVALGEAVARVSTVPSVLNAREARRLEPSRDLAERSRQWSQAYREMASSH